VAFIAPTRVGWALPLYELALMTAAELRAHGVEDAELFLVTPEARPLDVFGDEASAMVGRLLHAAARGRDGARVRAGTVATGGQDRRPLPRPLPRGPGPRPRRGAARRHPA
jgi:sulfide:quinone oxidoreductase